MGFGFTAESLLLITLLIPFIATIFIYIFRDEEDLRSNFLIGVTFLVFILTLIIIYLSSDTGYFSYQVSNVMEQGIYLAVTRFDSIFALLITGIWFLATVYAKKYMAGERFQNRFYVGWLFTLGGTLGTIFSGDLFTLFVFFEIMSITSYILIVHNQDQEALAAAKKYLYMSIVGGLAILMGVFLVYNQAGTMVFTEIAENIDLSGQMGYIIGFALLMGFGVKAGMFPVHIWLPAAHPVAPTPASALLSGIMIKTGIYGIIVTFNYIISPAISANQHLLEFFGQLIIVLGSITMFLGAFLAVFQKNMKTILAYSSVSQMGFILTGIGSAAYLGLAGSIGVESAMYHVISHALFKSSLFMIVGYIYLKTHDLDIYNYGGLWKKMPITMIAFIIGMFGIIGFPGFNGFISKNLLHEAVYKAYKLNYNSIIHYAEVVFTITSSITVLYFLKLFYYLFLGSESKSSKKIKSNDFSLLGILPFSLIAIFVFLTGVFPEFIYKNFIILSGPGFNYSGGIDILEINLYTMYFISSSFKAIGIGIISFIIFKFFSIYKIKIPEWLSLEFIIFRPIYKSLIFLSESFLWLFDQKVNDFQVGAPKFLFKISESFLWLFDKKVNDFQVNSPKFLYKISESFLWLFDKKITDVQISTPNILYKISDWFNNKFDKDQQEDEEDLIEIKSNPQEPIWLTILKKFYLQFAKINIILGFSKKQSSKNRIKEAKKTIASIETFDDLTCYLYTGKYEGVFWDIKNLDFDLYIALFILVVLMFFLNTGV
ncbi:MAG: complex I subunit 5 family protein [Bacillota bacterium]